MKVTEDLTLKDWLQKPHTQEELQHLFLNMDNTMHYIHNKGYGIVPTLYEGYPDFDPKDIRVITENGQQGILFQNVSMVFPNYRDELIRQNIYSLSVLAVKAYANITEKVRHEGLKREFEEFKMFVPEEDIPYYRGILLRNNSVYYADWVKERTKKEVQKEESALQGTSRSASLTKATEAGRFYSQLENNDTAAFIHLYIFPAIIIFLSFMIPFIAWIFALLEK